MRDHLAWIAALAALAWCFPEPCHGLATPARSRVGVVYTPEVLKHVSRMPHPECPERVETIREHLLASRGEELEWLGPDAAGVRDRTLALVADMHWDEYLRDFKLRCELGGGQIDADTYLGSESYEAILAATASWVAAVRRTAEEKKGPTFALARPPGHHATRSQGMGFCLVNHAAVAARYALDYVDGVDAVAILDFDVHHGNGIESLFREEPRVSYCSIHEANVFPFTGLASDHGMLNNMLNVPVASGSDWQVYEDKMDTQIMPFLRERNADLILVSAGYDALDDDALASVSLLPEDFGKITEKLVRTFGRDRIVLGLEGGYNLQTTPLAVAATLRALDAE